MKYLLSCLLALLLSVALASVDNRPRIKLTKKGIYPTTSTPYSLSEVKDNDSSGTIQQEYKPVIPKVYARPQSLEGWLTEPKQPALKNETRSLPAEKPGYCDHPQNYGIKCGVRMDQCKDDSDCPNVTKCCLVSDCGSLCVKPIEKLKPAKILKKKEKEEKVDDEESTIAVTTAEGLKINDITVIVPV